MELKCDSDEIINILNSSNRTFMELKWQSDRQKEWQKAF